MKQLVQSVRRGTVEILDVPPPQLRNCGVLVRSATSLVSAGTERAALQFAKGSLLAKAVSRPDLTSQMLTKMRRDGIVQAFETALSRLDKPVAPGYACAGTVVGVSPDVTDLQMGDRVACAGAGYATHAEINFIPRNLVVPIPMRAGGELVGFDEATFATLGAIALHGARLAQPQLGDRAVVIGLGAVGLLALQILRAHGCRVAAVDPNPARSDLARTLGADIVTSPDGAPRSIAAWTRELGADLVLVTAASTASDPAVLAADLSRDKGRIVAVGATGLNLPRRTLYEKELSLVVSRSYGPGRYDREYEEHGRDYPLPYVRWTERENMRAFLDLVADGSVKVGPLISHRFPIHDAERAYEALERQSVLGMVLEYPQHAIEAPGPTVVTPFPPPHASAHDVATKATVSFIGTGNFARTVLLPAFAREQDAQLRGAVAVTGLSARSAADKFDFSYCSTDASDVWRDQDCNAVIIATQHDTHARLVIQALDAGKAVFVEKPLCVTVTELDEIEAKVESLERLGRNPLMMVGFNRRFAPATTFVRQHFAATHAPLNVLYRVNAGRLTTRGHSTGERRTESRILGEVCHFVDLCGYLTGSTITWVSAVRSATDADEVIVTLRLANGSIATIAYLVDGDPAAPKERVEVFGGGAMGVIEDFRTATFTAHGRRRQLGGMFSSQNKGHAAEVRAFVRAVVNRALSPVPFDAAVNTTRATLAIVASLETGAPVDVHP